jgi:hypothetical protein
MKYRVTIACTKHETYEIEASDRETAEMDYTEGSLIESGEENDAIIEVKQVSP